MYAVPPEPAVPTFVTPVVNSVPGVGVAFVPSLTSENLKGKPVLVESETVSYTHLTLPTTPYV